MQEKTFDISNLGAIHTMSLYLYQENDFTYYGDDRQLQVVPVVDYDNILVKNLYLSFGSNIENIPDNTLKIYSENVLTFDSKAADISYNTKNINLLWYNKDESNKYIGFTDGIVDRDIEGNIIQYDEIEYMNNTKADARLAA
jgi:hypothetical protein